MQESNGPKGSRVKHPPKGTGLCAPTSLATGAGRGAQWTSEGQRGWQGRRGAVRDSLRERAKQAPAFEGPTLHNLCLSGFVVFKALFVPTAFEGPTLHNFCLSGFVVFKALFVLIIQGTRVQVSKGAGLSLDYRPMIQKVKGSRVGRVQRSKRPSAPRLVLPHQLGNRSRKRSPGKRTTRMARPERGRAR